MRAEIQASRVDRDTTVQPVRVGPAEGPKRVRILYILMEAEAEKKANLLRRGNLIGLRWVEDWKGYNEF